MAHTLCQAMAISAVEVTGGLGVRRGRKEPPSVREKLGGKTKSPSPSPTPYASLKNYLRAFAAPTLYSENPYPSPRFNPLARKPANRLPGHDPRDIFSVYTLYFSKIVGTEE